MPENPKKFYLTTPIYYVNARPHIGHAYTTIVADVIARRRRLLGDDTFLLTGTDEHGQKIERSAAAAGIPPQQFADQVAASFQNLWKRMGITNDDFIRTTEARHQRGVQRLFSTLKERGFIELRTYTGQYCVSEEVFVDGPPGTIGPDGKPTETVSEENFFFKLSEFQRPLLDLIESDTLHIQPESRKNEVLSFLRGPVSTGHQSSGAPSMPEPHPGMGGNANPSPLESAIAYSAKGSPYVPGALKDLSISRSSFTWGVPVPEPAASETKEKHVIYVWLDALANYMTAVGYGSDAPADIARFERYWPADLHLVGKEIIRFHCVYWPAFLMAMRPAQVFKSVWNAKWLPKSIVAHGWLLFEESKMSKSRGNIVRTETILDAFGEHVYAKQFPDSAKAQQDLFAADVLRYFLLREIPFGQDGSFSFDALIQRYNSDLANGYGNLVSRVLMMIESNFNGVVPEAPQDFLISGDRVQQGTNDLVILMSFSIETYSQFLDSYDFAIALSAPFSKIAATDRYISDQAPWKLAKNTDEQSRKKLSEILYTAAESIRIVTALLYPFLPYATASVWRQLGLGSIEEAARKGELKDLQWGGLKPGTKLGPLAPIFPRADKGLAQIMTDMESSAPAAPEPSATSEPSTTLSGTGSVPAPSVSSVSGPSPAETTEAPAFGIVASTDSLQPATGNSPQITIDDFAKVDLRVAQIVVAERIPKADKLLRLEVDLGYERRQILAGIAEHYAPETLIGRKVVIVANLAPRKLRGLESNGMIVAASIGPAGAPVLAGFLEDVELGARLK